MVTLQEVEKQLEAIGANSRYWGRAEIVELPHILFPDEQIKACMNGRYQGGFATFVVTDQRLLLIDKKPFYLTVEDMRYDMISEVDFGAQLLSGSLRVCTPTKTLTFSTFRPKALRQVTMFIQEHVMKVRQAPQNQPRATVVPQPSFAETYAPILGNQAMSGAEGAPTALPLPIRRNPYMNPPFMTRRRVGRFGPVSTPDVS